MLYLFVRQVFIPKTGINFWKDTLYGQDPENICNYILYEKPLGKRKGPAFAGPFQPNKPGKAYWKFLAALKVSA